MLEQTVKPYYYKWRFHVFSVFEFTNWRTADNDNNDSNDEVDVDNDDDDVDDDGDSTKPTVQDFDTGETRARLIRGALRVTASKLIRTLINIGVLIREFQNHTTYKKESFFISEVAISSIF